MKYPNWAVWVCDKQGRAYQNWCYAACNGCYWYTPCEDPNGGECGNTRRFESLLFSNRQLAAQRTLLIAGVTVASSSTCLPQLHKTHAATCVSCSSCGNNVGGQLLPAHPHSCRTCQPSNLGSPLPCLAVYGPTLARCMWSCTICHHHSPGHVPAAGKPSGDDVLVMRDGDCEYRLYDTRAAQMKTYGNAQAFCRGLGAGWDLVPYTDPAGFNAVRQLCANNLFTVGAGWLSACC